MSTGPDLPLPDAVLNHKAVRRGWITEDHARQLARPFLVAELRRLAGQSRNYARGIAGFNGGGHERAEAMSAGARGVADALEHRADELENP